MSTRIADSALRGDSQPALHRGPVGFRRIFPLAVPLGLGALFVLAQWQGIIPQLSTETGLVTLALVSYLAASVLSVMFVIQREPLLERVTIVMAAVGLGANVAAWGTRGLIAQHYPLTNLYDTALALGVTTAAATLVMAATYRHRFVSTITLPVAAMFLILASLYGNQLTEMPPVLVSYWRPIHVSIAMTAYGVCALTFALGLLYLLKDGMKTETLGLFVMLVPLLTYVFLSGGRILTDGAFEISLLIHGSRIPVNEANTEFLRATIPYVGQVFRLALVGSLAVILCFAGYLIAQRETLKAVGHWLVRGLLIIQAAGLGLLFYEMKVASPVDLIVPGQRALIPAAWLNQFGPQLELHYRGNPVGIACIVVAVAVTAFLAFFAWKRERILEAVPSLSTLDDLTYKAVSVAFPLLVLMTITGAVWANESWGRYWGWDPKEMWAFITCLIYAVFLHTRIVHGWKGRKTALFAVVGFISVIFTYLGVSFILPGLHSYATL